MTSDNNSPLLSISSVRTELWLSLKCLTRSCQRCSKYTPSSVHRCCQFVFQFQWGISVQPWHPSSTPTSDTSFPQIFLSTRTRKHAPFFHRNEHYSGRTYKYRISGLGSSVSLWIMISLMQFYTWTLKYRIWRGSSDGVGERGGREEKMQDKCRQIQTS